MLADMGCVTMALRWLGSVFDDMAADGNGDKDEAASAPPTPHTGAEQRLNARLMQRVQILLHRLEQHTSFSVQRYLSANQLALFRGTAGDASSTAAAAAAAAAADAQPATPTPTHSSYTYTSAVPTFGSEYSVGSHTTGDTIYEHDNSSVGGGGGGGGIIIGGGGGGVIMSPLPQSLGGAFFSSPHTPQTPWSGSPALQQQQQQQQPQQQQYVQATPGVPITHGYEVQQQHQLLLQQHLQLQQLQLQKQQQQYTESRDERRQRKKEKRERRERKESRRHKREPSLTSNEHPTHAQRSMSHNADTDDLGRIPGIRRSASSHDDLRPAASSSTTSTSTSPLDDTGGVASKVASFLGGLVGVKPVKRAILRDDTSFRWDESTGKWLCNDGSEAPSNDDGAPPVPPPYALLQRPGADAAGDDTGLKPATSAANAANAFSSQGQGLATRYASPDGF
jgi:hypothetical protein